MNVDRKRSIESKFWGGFSKVWLVACGIGFYQQVFGENEGKTGWVVVGLGALLSFLTARLADTT